MTGHAAVTLDNDSRIPPRARILAAAGELFYRHGIRAVGVDAIAEAAGTNKMTLYRHFDSKDLLIAEYVRSLAADGDRLHPLQEAMRDCHGLQCGYCTPGILMTMKVFLDETPQPDEAQIREALSGNLCRCTGYQHIVAAVALGARTVLVGRAYLYGLMAGGERGVERATGILSRQIYRTMQLLGVRSISELDRRHVRIR